MALQRLGRQQDAIPWFQKVIQRDPHNASALTNLGLALTLTGKAKEALDSLSAGRWRVDPKDAVIYKDLGVAHVQLSAFDEAIADFEKALALDPNDPQLHYDLGLAYKFKDRFNDAIAELSRAGQMDPTLQDPPYTLGHPAHAAGQAGRCGCRAAEGRGPAAGERRRMGHPGQHAQAGLAAAGGRRGAAERRFRCSPASPARASRWRACWPSRPPIWPSRPMPPKAPVTQKKAAELRGQMKDLRSQVVELRREGAALARSAVSRQRANFAMNAGNQLMLRGQIADAVAPLPGGHRRRSHLRRAAQPARYRLRAPGPRRRGRRRDAPRRRNLPNAK